MSRIKEAMDPTRVLPKVVFIAATRSDSGLGLQEIRWSGILLGGMSTRRDQNGERYFSSITIDPYYRGNKFGLSAYINAIEIAHEHGDAFRCDREVSKRAAGIWQKFIQSGITEIIEPLEERVHDYGDACAVSYTGYVRINPDLHT
jgi:hypothetical protein